MDPSELEVALQQRWNPQTLAVYGDALQAAGELRGELIAIDLHADTHGLSPEAADRRVALIRAWLGDAFDPALIRYGFFDNSQSACPDDGNLALLAALDASPAAAFVRGLRIAKWDLPASELDRLLVPRPWLTRLRIGTLYEQVPTAAWHAAFESNTPNLDELWFDGVDPKLALHDIAFAHSRVRRLVWTESGLDLRASRLPNVTEVAFDYDSWGKYLFSVLPNIRVVDQFMCRYCHALPAHVTVVNPLHRALK